MSKSAQRRASSNMLWAPGNTDELGTLIAGIPLRSFAVHSRIVPFGSCHSSFRPRSLPVFLGCHHSGGNVHCSQNQDFL